LHEIAIILSMPEIDLILQFNFEQHF